MNTVMNWKNAQYGSVMTLQQTPSGEIFGVYRSHTGSTGQYAILGYGDPLESSADTGRSMSIAIYWRSLAGGDADESWHWVSGLSGQLTVSGAENNAPGTPCLELTHAMVATCDFPGLATAGTYVDKLLYEPTDSGGLLYPMADWSTIVDCPINGRWASGQGQVLELRCNDLMTGAVSGSLRMGVAEYALQGFTDTFAEPGKLALQGLTLSVMIPAAGTSATRCISFAGSLDLNARRLVLTELASQGTQAGSGYLATKLAQHSFHPL